MAGPKGHRFEEGIDFTRTGGAETVRIPATKEYGRREYCSVDRLGPAGD